MDGGHPGRFERARRRWTAAEETLADVVGRHPLTTAAMGLSALTWLQPQIWHVVADVSVPPPHAGSWLRAALFAAFLVVTLAGAIGGAILIVPYEPTQHRELPETTVVARWFLVVARRISRLVHGIPMLERLVELLVPPADLDDARIRRRRGLALAVFAAALAWMIIPALARAGWLGSCGERMPLALALTSVAGYLALCAVPTRTGRNLGRFLVMLVIGLVLGELAWILAPRVGGSYRFYVVWAVPFVQWMVIAVGRIADDWPTPAGRRVRWGVVLALVGVMLVDAGVAIETIGHLPVPAAQAATGAGVAVDRADTGADSGADAAWLDALAARIERNRSGPVIFVAASGGGSRAAMFAALVFELLGKERIDPTAPAERAGETVAGNVSLVSSVSGGSLATAYFVSGRGAASAGRQPLDNMDAVDIARRMSRLAAEYHDRARACKSYWDPWRCERLLPDWKKLDARLEVLARVERTAGEAARAFLAGQPPRGDDGWVLTSGFVDDMAIDFMAPLLRGVISPFRERGETVADFWQQRFGWPARETAAWDAGRAPLVFFNATEVATGKRLVIPFPPTSPALFPTDPLVLSTTAKEANVRLADAVRLSANFPWGFEIGEVKRVPPGGGPPERIRIIDGGVTDNTGIDSLAALVVRIEELAAGVGEPVPGAVAAGARRLRDLLVARGLLVIEIDSGAKPTRGGVLDRIPVISEPLDALAHARYGGETALKAAHLARLKGALVAMREHENLSEDLRALPDKRPALAHVELTCNRADAIMTAWSLGPEDKAKILASFLVEAALARTSLRQTLGQGTNTRAEVENLLARTPPRRVREHVNSALAAEATLAREAETRNAAATAARKAMYVELDKRDVAAPRAQQPNLAPPMATAPESTPPAPASNLAPHLRERAACTPAPPGHRDWVYLGTCEGTTWRTRYFRLPSRDPAALGEGDTLVTVGRTHVRASLPDAAGSFSGVRTVIPAETEVTLAGCAQRWSDSDFWWAPIASPPATAD